jgi:hypothetical protein
MRKGWKHIVTGLVISEYEYSLLTEIQKTNFEPLIIKTRENDSYVRK